MQEGGAETQVLSPNDTNFSLARNAGDTPWQSLLFFDSRMRHHAPPLVFIKSKAGADCSKENPRPRTR